MSIEAKIVCDSVGPNGVRLTTFLLKYPRFIHSEFMTHRMFSRNASSSRAIPFEKQMQMIRTDMAMPLEFRKNQKGMQAGEALDEQGQMYAQATWVEAGVAALKYAEELAAAGVHKQYVNRLVEPFAHITVVCTATEYANFFALRHHSMAQPEIAELARQMWNLYSTNNPKTLKAGEWHLPFVTDEEVKAAYFPGGSIIQGNVSLDVYMEPYTDWDKLRKMSVARCARTSYLNHDGTNSTYEQDCALYDRLLSEQPIHASPAEHQALARDLVTVDDSDNWISTNETFSGNLRGWTQHRKLLKGENITSFTGPLG